MSDKIRAIADSYDDDGDGLAEAAFARLRWRARRGRKSCSACGEDLPVSAFGPDVRRRDGLRSACRPCEASASRSRRVV